ncbi:hypothetical protein ATY31_20410 [Sinorhizobium americanum]|uniref:Uncharacterized protein n=1 Tax=Sinorhizobium americanum TaxID=194963 RepID=A0A2S3YJE5_9HYPH|nr:hypothetical protein ATY31_20410 [Sinorhizobium americanum]
MMLTTLLGDDEGATLLLPFCGFDAFFSAAIISSRRACGRIKRHRTGHFSELDIAFPIRSWTNHDPDNPDATQAIQANQRRIVPSRNESFFNNLAAIACSFCESH